jgi:predicted RNA binding protein YcfA (HicA-like mRNA interferase family)
MSSIPSLSWREVLRAFEKAGYFVHHQKGSHIILKNRSRPYNRLSLPRHRTIKRGTLRGLLRQAGIKREEFLSLLK